MLIGYRIKELAEAEVPISADAEVANRGADAVPIDPHASVSEPVEPAPSPSGQPAARSSKHRSSC